MSNIITVRELQAKLLFLTLAGQNEDGELEWIGSEEDWQMAESFGKLTIRK